MKIMIRNKNTTLLTLFLLVCVTSVALLSGCVNATSGQGRQLAVTRLGFKTDNDAPLTPGKTVTVYADSNRKAGVSYTWNVPGTYKQLSSKSIAWTVPTTPGDYTVSLTCVASSLGQTATRSTKVTVVDDAAVASPETFSCSIKAVTQFTNKLIGEKGITTTSRISKDATGNVSVETTPPVGDTIKTSTDNGSTYSIAADGTRTLVSQISDGSPEMPFSPSMLSLDSLKASCPTWTSDVRYFTFEQRASSQYGKIVFDSRLGVLTKIRSEDDDLGEVQDIKITYQTIDGYLIPAHIEGDITYMVADEPYTIHCSQDMEDIVVNGTQNSESDTDQ